ncbi:uncharacterized protein LOC144865553 [Branchiostoma floridae x Branchiostoma japonicum]
MATPTLDIQNVSAGTELQPLSRQNSITGAAVNRLNADVTGVGNTVVQMGNNCNFNFTIQYNTDPRPWGMNRTVGDNQQGENDISKVDFERLVGSKFSGFVCQEGMHTFHPSVHGTQICIENNATVARSRDSFNNSLCFSEMPVKVGEKVYLKVIDSRLFDESLRFGFTSEDPRSMTREKLPPQSYPALAQQPGFWIKPLPASQAHQGCVVTFSLEESGDVTFAVDGEDKGLFFSGVDVSNPLWAVVDVHGSTVAVQFVGNQAVSEAFDKRIHEGDQVKVLENDTETLRDMQASHGGFTSEMSKVKGAVGIAVRVDQVDVHVFFPDINKRWCITPAALQKVKMPDIRSKAIIGGDLVKIAVGKKKLQSIQKKHHLWKNGMEKIRLNKTARVRGVMGDGQLVVRMEGKRNNTWVFHPKVVVKTANQEVS